MADNTQNLNVPNKVSADSVNFKIPKRILIIAIAICLALAMVMGTLSLAARISRQPTTYPYVFVHGLNGYGTDTDIGQLAPYWGAVSCNLMDELERRGYTCVAPSGGPSASAWDRACELYAALTGTTVDYGEAHSKEFGHERFGKTYTSALLPNWGEKDNTGNIQKINIIAHSFGGASSRMLAELLANGCEEERKASGDSCSPLFAGGKGNLIFSITALTAPHNGTTLLEAVNDSRSIKTMLNMLGVALKSPAGKVAGDVLEQFGIDIQNLTSGEQPIDEIISLSNKKDNAYYDLTLRGAKELNDRISTLPNVYYFSQPADGTKDSLGGNRRVANYYEMFLPLQATAYIMGRYTDNKYEDIPINSSWLPNDGLVPTISMTAPSGAAQAEFTENTALKKGVWYVYPTMRGDHGKPIGLLQDSDWLIPFYLEQIERIDELSRIDSSNWLSLWIYRRKEG